MAEVVKTTFRLRRGDIKTWEKNNPVLKKGEPGVAYENGRVKCLKIGDGISPWNRLQAIGAGEAGVGGDDYIYIGTEYPEDAPIGSLFINESEDSAEQPMAVLEYLNGNNEWKKVNAYGVSSIKGQQGDVKITPESIGAPTIDRVERLNRELQERLEKVEWKDVTEDFNNSGFVDSPSDYFLTLRNEGNYYINIGSKGYCKIYKIDTNIYHDIITYTNNGIIYICKYANNSLTFDSELNNGMFIHSDIYLQVEPTEDSHPTTKRYVDNAIANALTTIDNAEALSF